MISVFEDRILALIDDLVEKGSDDELFAGGYLQGHITLAVAEVENNNEQGIDALSRRVEASIDQAIQAGELAPADQLLVKNLWLKLFKMAQ